MQTILYLIPHCSTGGGPQYLYKKLELLQDDYETYVIVWNDQAPIFDVQKKRIQDLIGNRLIIFNMAESKKEAELFRKIESIKPHIIHMEEIPEMWMTNRELLIKLYRLDRPYKIVETTHDSSFNIENKLFFPDKFSFVSRWSLEQFKPLGIPMELVEYPIEYNIRPNRKEALEELGLDPEYKHVLNVGLFTSRKNQAEVFEYARMLSNEKIQFHFVGNQADNFKGYWEPLMKNKPLNCIIWGERHDTDKFYSSMDLFLFTSLGREGDKETNPLVLKEAISWQMPILLYNLDVYLGQYDNHDNVVYLKNDDKEYNKNRILRILGLSTTEIEPIIEEVPVENIEYETNDQVIDEHKHFLLIYSHNYLVNDWRTVVEEQWEKVFKTGLYHQANHIFIGVYSPIDDTYNEFVDIISKYDPYKRFTIARYKENNHEFSTLQQIQEDINGRFKGRDDLILYFHTKGVTSKLSHPGDNVSDEAVTSWRHLLEYFNIEKWQNNIKLLDEGYDTVGALYHDENQFYWPNIYSGNFWWTHSNYVRNLPEINEEFMKDRMNAEKWICLAPRKWYNYYSPAMDSIYEHVFKRFEYADPPTIIPQSKEIPEIKEIDYTFFIENKDFSSFGDSYNKDDEVFVVTSHPNYKATNDITLRCIKALKETGRKVILATHCPISQELQESVDYFVYDKNNPLIEHDFFCWSWYDYENYFAKLNIKKYGNNLNHAPAVSNNYFSGIAYADKLGYKKAICINFDIIVTKEDSIIFENLCKKIVSENKHAYFMCTKEQEGMTLKTIFFIIKPSYFLNYFKYMKTEEDYKNYISKVGSETNCLENTYYNTLKSNLDNLLLEETTEEDIFPTSEVNLFSMVEYFTVLPIENDNDNFIVWYSSSNKIDDRIFTLEIYKNDALIFTKTSNVGKDLRYFEKVHFEQGSEFKLKLIIRNIHNLKVMKEKIIIIDDKEFDSIKDNGIFIDKKHEIISIN